MLSEEEQYERMLVKNEFSEIIKCQDTALKRLKRFKEGYPYLVAPNILDMIIDNLKDNIAILLREMPNIEKFKKREYEQKYVCEKCKGVFFISLPNGVCDECRGKHGIQ